MASIRYVPLLVEIYRIERVRTILEKVKQIPTFSLTLRGVKENMRTFVQNGADFFHRYIVQGTFCSHAEVYTTFTE